MQSSHIYQLNHAGFFLTMQGGLLTSIRPGAALTGKTDTEFVYPGKAFGQPVLTVRTVRGLLSAALSAPQEEAPQMVHAARDMTASQVLSAPDFPVEATVAYTLSKMECHLEIALRNTAEEALTVADFALPFPCNTRFDWDIPANDKVLGHHFIAGHGSHLVFERCDGFGPMLVVFPERGTSLEYFAMTEQSERQKHGFCAYIHSEEARKAALAAGAKPRDAATSVQLLPGESRSYFFGFAWATDNEDARRLFVQHDLADLQALPGMTVPQDHTARLVLTTRWQHPVLSLPNGTPLVPVKQEGDRFWYEVSFPQLGEQDLRLTDDRGRTTHFDFFVTEPLQTLLEKRAAFIAAHQHRDPSKWYYGLLAEHNNETGVMLGPDHYDHIKGWRIYEVSCDDPGLGKPAFLSGKLAELPNEEQLRAIDLYVEQFVWGGLQCTEEEPYPYGLYGIPDWKTLRDSKDPGNGGQTHIWRIYDYPHIFTMYYNLYRVKKQHPDAPLSQTANTYLKRAYHTAVALFTIPLELEDWSAFITPLYNEHSIEGMIEALGAEGMTFEKLRLERLWKRKAYRFVQNSADIFGSEYPFDTTGFESTHLLANYALRIAHDEVQPVRFSEEIERTRALAFMETQHRANVSCRGVLEPAYYWYGSDYRGNNVHYTLSYMSQMGGASILDYALYHAEDPFEDLRLGFGSLMSSWALMNSGTEASNYGYFFPGKEHDGAACGGFEPLYLGETWLEQPHHGGPWYYSCEIDLGFCGYLHGASTILAEDPLFGRICLGGSLAESEDRLEVTLQDGVNRRFHYVDDHRRLHLTLDVGRLQKVVFSPKTGEWTILVDAQGIACPSTLTMEQEGFAGEARRTETFCGGLQTLSIKLL